MYDFQKVNMTESGISCKIYQIYIKVVGITEFQDIEIINCIQDSETNEGELMTGNMKVVMLPLK